MPLIELDKGGCVACPLKSKSVHHLECCEHRGGILEVKKVLLLECFNPKVEAILRDDAPIEADVPMNSEEIRFVEDSEIASDPYEPLLPDLVVGKPKFKSGVK